MIQLQGQSGLFFQSWVRSLFSWQWWLLLGLAIIPWIIWWHIVDQKGKQEMLLFGLFVALIATFLDAYGWSRNV